MKTSNSLNPREYWDQVYKQWERAHHRCMALCLRGDCLESYAAYDMVRETLGTELVISGAELNDYIEDTRNANIQR